jgi:hypothetical protein
MQQVISLLKSAQIGTDIVNRVEALFLQTKASVKHRDDDDSDDHHRHRARSSKRSSSRHRTSSVSKRGSSRSKSPGRSSHHRHHSRSKSPGRRGSSKVRSSRSSRSRSPIRSHSKGRRSYSALDRDDAQSLISSVSTHKPRPVPINTSSPNNMLSSPLGLDAPGTAAMNFGGVPMSRAALARQAVGMGHTPHSPATKSIQANQGIPSPLNRNAGNSFGGSSGKQQVQQVEIPQSPSRSTQALQQSLQFQPPRRQLSAQSSSMQSSPSQLQQQLNSPMAGMNGNGGNRFSPTLSPAHASNQQGRPIPRGVSQQMPTSRLFTPSGSGGTPTMMPVNNGGNVGIANGNTGGNVGSYGANQGLADGSPAGSEGTNSSKKKSDPSFWAFF